MFCLYRVLSKSRVWLTQAEAQRSSVCTPDLTEPLLQGPKSKSYHISYMLHVTAAAELPTQNNWLQLYYTVTSLVLSTGVAQPMGCALLVCRLG
jgi:hypothetical protein